MGTLDKLSGALSSLENKIESITGTRVALKVDEKYSNYTGENFFEINSNDFSSQLCGLTKPIFKEIRISTNGGYKVKGDEDYIWFRVAVIYTHFGGGSNGTDYIWSCLYFNTKNGEWDFDISKQICN